MVKKLPDCEPTLTQSQPSIDPAPLPADFGASPWADSNPFSLASQQLSRSFDEAIGVSQLLVVVSIRRPGKADWVRVRPGDEYRSVMPLLELKEHGELYQCAPILWEQLGAFMSTRLVVTAITRTGLEFLWPLRLPGSDGRLDSWSRSALAAAEQAETRWVRLQSNRSAGLYDVFVGSESLPEPTWRDDYSFEQLVDKAFADFRIADSSHPVVRQLKGLV